MEIRLCHTVLLLLLWASFEKKGMARATADYASCDYLFIFQCFWATYSWNTSELASLSSAVRAVVSPLQAFCYVSVAMCIYKCSISSGLIFHKHTQKREVWVMYQENYFAGTNRCWKKLKLARQSGLPEEVI